MTKSPALYNAEISAGSLMLVESRRIARLLLTHPDRVTWVDTLKHDNILQKKSPATARRQARLIRNRLETLDELGWQMVADGEQEIALQILLAAAIKHSRLLGDFMRDVVAEHLRRLEHTLSPANWDAFLADCAQRDSVVGTWSPGTQAKLLQVVLRMLAEARYLESTRNLQLTPPMLHPEVLRYLQARSETAVLAAMELKQ
ncbi:DUF1819 family protein [Aromatoleum aromaticum]|uniref:DUF1819 family protein n=1 Tax=Aromatoleum aromaticum (strain DSM 19018 / LMG 30748 / EbN1) TaxID=76114 RepID=Q5P0S9_AROAE|nr:DUF1819 family protein [Aromatoleum aromaticum]CAI09085.1 conserved hypothetical protein [Aromatoleum aromaticum EbN1]